MEDPRHAVARDALRDKHFEEAERLYSEIVTDDQKDTEAHYHLAAMQLRRNDTIGAEKSILAAVTTKPMEPRYQVALGQIRVRQGQYANAENAFVAALALDPSNGDAYTNLGGMQFDLARYEEAEFTLRKALIYHPHHRQAATQLGRVLLRLHRTEEAVSLFHAVLQTDPHNASVQINIGIGCVLLGDFASANEAFETALARNPENIEAHVNYAHLLLLLGNYRKGYEEHEWRLRRPDYRDLSSFHGPMWTGEALTGRTILLWGEQGLGDIIHFARYIPLIADRAGRVAVECNPALHRLIKEIPVVDEVFDLNNACNYDFHLPLMSLPLHCGTDKIPTEMPYLSIPRLANLGPYTGLRVGLVWAGNPKHARDRERSRELCEFAPLTARRDVNFYSLQKGDAFRQPPPDAMNLIDLGSSFQDMADTAAAIQALDLVISIDSAPAHLAGALGVPIWLLLPRIPDWRWGLKGEDTPWYPSMRLFRERNGWPEVIQRIAEALTDFSPSID